MSYEEKVSDWFDTSQALGEVLIIAERADQQIKELKANNKRLREHIKQGMEPAEDNYECEVYMEECWAVLEETPAQSLREIEANAIDRFVKHVQKLDKVSLDYLDGDFLGCIEKVYINKLREES